MFNMFKDHLNHRIMILNNSSWDQGIILFQADGTSHQIASQVQNMKSCGVVVLPQRKGKKNYCYYFCMSLDNITINNILPFII